MPTLDAAIIELATDCRDGSRRPINEAIKQLDFTFTQEQEVKFTGLRCPINWDCRTNSADLNRLSRRWPDPSQSMPIVI